MKRWLVVAAILTGAASAAQAADKAMYPADQAAAMAMPPAIALAWAGPYLGAFVGGGWGNVDVTDGGYNGPPVTAGNFSFGTSGFTGGGLVGWNWQKKNFVGGFEGEAGYLGLTGSAQYPPFVGVRSATDSVDSISTDFYAALTARAGFTAGRFLFYGKGGVAGVNANASYTDTDAVHGITLVSGTGASKFMVGWTLGAGIEGMLHNGWNWRAEYMYTDFGNIGWTGTGSNTKKYNFGNDLTTSTVKVMLTKHW